jgi:hypothetical protein
VYAIAAMRLPKDADVGGQFEFVASDAAATIPMDADTESDEPTTPCLCPCPKIPRLPAPYPLPLRR